jgi:hypothetical protein
MKMTNQTIRNCVLLFALATGLAFSIQASAGPADAPVRVEPPASILFTGNSLTFYNNAIYTHLRKFLVAEDPSLRQRIFLKSMTISGAKLADHAGGLIQTLHSRSWDVVVLQGHSREAIDADMEEGFESTLRLFAKQIRERGAEPVLFMTWAYADRPEMAPRQARAFTRLGEKLEMMVIPVGLAFERALQSDPDLALHNEDRIHPSLEGTYLAAAVFYAALYRKSPLELDYDAGLDADVARQLRKTAWETVEDYYAPAGE